MRIVELDLILVGELGPVVRMDLFVASDNILERGRAEEVLLLQSQLFTSEWKAIKRSRRSPLENKQSKL